MISAASLKAEIDTYNSLRVNCFGKRGKIYLWITTMKYYEIKQEKTKSIQLRTTNGCHTLNTMSNIIYSCGDKGRISGGYSIWYRIWGWLEVQESVV